MFCSVKADVVQIYIFDVTSPLSTFSCASGALRLLSIKEEKNVNCGFPVRIKYFSWASGALRLLSIKDKKVKFPVCMTHSIP